MPTTVFYSGQKDYIPKLNDLWDRATISIIGTSADSLTLSVGNKAFTTNTNLQFTVGSLVIITATGDLSKYMSGQVVSYIQSTGAITVNVTSVSGSGTLSSWSVTLSGVTGVADNLTIGTVTEGVAAASITGTSPNKSLNLTLQTGATGAAGLTARGAWNGTTAYVITPSVDWVTYAGSSYYRKVAGTTPTDPATDTVNWGILAQKGVDGSVTGVTAASPLSSTGGTSPVISIPKADTTTSGYLHTDDWDTFNNKAPINNPNFTGVIGTANPEYVGASIRPNLLLDFANGKTINPLITFTRASAAWSYDEKGNYVQSPVNTPRFKHNPVTGACEGLFIERASTNLLTYSENFDNAAWGKANSSVIPNAMIAPDGTLTADKLVESIGANLIHSAYEGLTVASSSITFSCYVKAGERTKFALSSYEAVTPSNPLIAFFDLTTKTATNGTASTTGASIVDVGGGWFRCSASCNSMLLVYTAFYLQPYTGASVQYTGDGTSGIYIWGAQLEAGELTSYIPSALTFTSRASSGTYIDNTGSLATATTNVARMSYTLKDLTAPAKLLLEAAATNSIRNNSMQGAVAGIPGTIPTNWAAILSPSGCSREIVGIGTENGIDYIDVRFFGIVSGAGQIFAVYPDVISSAAATVGQTWSSSFYVKLQSGSLNGVTGTWNGVDEYNSGSVFILGGTLQIAPTNASLISQRYSYSHTVSSATAAFVRNVVYGLVTNGAAIDFTLRIGMPQLELNPTGIAGSTSVIRTTGAAATRAADISSSAQTTRAADLVSITGTNFSSWYRQDEGTFVVEASTSKTSGNAPILTTQIAVGTSRHQIGMFSNTSITVDGGVVQSTFGVNTSNSATIAYAYKVNDFANSISGGALVTDTSGTVPTALTYMTIGKFDFGGGESLDGTISRIYYYPKRLTNAELQGVSAL